MQACLLRTLAHMDAWRAEAGISEASLLNVVVTDGETVVASRVVLPLESNAKAASLYFTSGSRWAPAAGEPPAPTATLSTGVEYCMMQADRRETAVIIASERLSANEDDWLTVPKNSLLVVHPSMALLRVPVTALPALDDACTVASGHATEEASSAASTSTSVTAHSVAGLREEVDALSHVSGAVESSHLYTRGGKRPRMHALSSEHASAIHEAWMEPWKIGDAQQTRVERGNVYLAKPAAVSPAPAVGSPSLRPQMFCAGRAFQTMELQQHGACDGAASSAPASPELRPSVASMNGAALLLSALT